MNQQNFDYLKDQVKYTGFGDGLEKDLKEQLQKQASEFQLAYRIKIGQDMAAVTLHFKKSDQSDLYFFNRYQLTLKPDQDQQQINQTFYIHKGQNITLKEAYNLLNGRAVNKDLLNKEGQIYNAWLQLDFKQTEPNGNFKIKQFHQNYSFNLEAALAKYHIKELKEEPEKSRLLESLQKGNRQAVTLIQEGREQKHYIEANPRFKTMNLYDGNLQRLNHNQLKAESQTTKHSEKQEMQKTNVKPVQEPAGESTTPAQKRGKKNGATLH
ncbi:hypothetical protein [Adhaeribacter rhizoryzae]|uniref:DUF3945 domain-containing protein n=1 Tax=Adhaeribacter rhizoryzae TaxID=2607907 RepID=A0A5M6DKR9_9BACT|nr:hypothetical protein [Adhaeribacter rhizoryzae]KAA5548124.1 hypothetical protein F0145_05190 [Adhaeribacter rhizoryzae]